MFRCANIILVIAIISLICCSKEKRYANRLDEKSWVLTSKIDGDNFIDEDEGVVVYFNDCDIYDELCTGKWTKQNNYSSEFYWQITNKGKEFILSNKTQTDNHASGPEAFSKLVVIQTCYNYSGTYSIEKFKKCGKDILRLKCSNTFGYPGKLVELELKEK
jgi:hypothetical protein